MSGDASFRIVYVRSVSIALACAIPFLSFLSAHARQAGVETTTSKRQPTGRLQSTGQLQATNNIAGWGLESLYQMEAPLRGAASCATSSCHGGPKPGVASHSSPRGSEHARWIEQDPHARSWNTLCSDTSVQIMNQLKILQDGKISDLTAFQNCLACHNTDRSLLAGNDIIAPNIMEGVGCEACHGPAERWYDKHYQSQEAIQTAKREHGLVDLESWVQRAKQCAMCHVGASDRDMNHDIIAAGHPALYFDMAVYYEAYPKHWRDPHQDDSSLRAKLWLAGQIANADAELELLVSRAARTNPHSVWPELSNYACSSCHVALDGIPKPTSPLSRKFASSGNAPVREWNLIGLESLAHFPNSNADSAEIWNNLKSYLQNPINDRDRIPNAAVDLRLRIASIAQTAEHGDLGFWTNQSQSRLAANQLELANNSHSWEHAAAAYTTAWSALPNRRSLKLDSAMHAIRQALLFPVNTQSPIFPRKVQSSTPPNLEQWTESLRNAARELLKK